MTSTTRAARFRRLGHASMLVMLAGCVADVGGPIGDREVADYSREAVMLELAFSGELVTEAGANPRTAIKDQLLFTIGQLNHINGWWGPGAGPRLSRLQISNLAVRQLGDLAHVSYSAVLPVAWATTKKIPAELNLLLPRDMTVKGRVDFLWNYERSCFTDEDHGDGLVVDNMFVYYAPTQEGCELSAQDIVSARAAVTRTEMSGGTYPEYDRVWSDGVLKVLVVATVFERGAFDPHDPGVESYDALVKAARGAFPQLAALPSVEKQTAGAFGDVTLRWARAGGETPVVEIAALLISSPSDASDSVKARYAELSERADLILYNGHSRWGENIRALAQMGRWVAGQYQILFLDGCSTLAYLDETLAKAHAAVNPDDPSRTKYLDLVMNAMPSLFQTATANSVAFIQALAAPDQPQTYEQILAKVDPHQMAVVVGDEDNTYAPPPQP